MHVHHLCDFEPQTELHIVSVINTLQERTSEGYFGVFGTSRTKSVSKVFTVYNCRHHIFCLIVYILEAFMTVAGLFFQGCEENNDLAT